MTLLDELDAQTAAAAEAEQDDGARRPKRKAAERASDAFKAGDDKAEPQPKKAKKAPGEFRALAPILARALFSVLCFCLLPCCLFPSFLFACFCPFLSGPFAARCPFYRSYRHCISWTSSKFAASANRVFLCSFFFSLLSLLFKTIRRPGI
jgi:hypothetical protein